MNVIKKHTNKIILESNKVGNISRSKTMTMIFRICFTTNVDNKRIGTRNHVLTRSKYTLEKTEGAIKNEQFRDSGNIGYTRHRTKTSKIKI